MILRSCEVELHFEKNGRDPGINFPVQHYNYTCMDKVQVIHSVYHQSVKITPDVFVITSLSQAYCFSPTELLLKFVKENLEVIII